LTSTSTAAPRSWGWPLVSSAGWSRRAASVREAGAAGPVRAGRGGGLDRGQPV